MSVYAPPVLTSNPMTQASLSSRSESTREAMSSGCIGARVRLDGNEYLTTVTHGFLYHEGHPDGTPASPRRRLKALIIHPGGIIDRQLRSGVGLVGTPVYATTTPSTDERNERIGRIARSFDRLRSVMSWPADFPHDLTPVAAEAPNMALPKLFVPPIPQIDDEFMKSEELWRQEEKECFIAYHSAYKSESYTYVGKLCPPAAQKCLIEGFQATWPVRADFFQRSFLWRTETESINLSTRRTKSGDQVSV